MTRSTEAHMVLLTKAEMMLAQVDKADEALKLADMAEAARVWARKAGAGTNLVNHATMIKARALKRMADVVTAGQKIGKIAKAGKPKDIIPSWNNIETLIQLGISARKLHQARKLDKLSEADIKKVVAQADADDREVTYNELIILAKQGAQDKKRKIKQARETEQEVEREARNFKVKPGQLWALGHHTLMCGDAYDPIQLHALTNKHKPDAFISDPPYGIDYSPDWKKYDGRPSDFRKVIGDDKSFDPSQFMDFRTVVMFGANYFSDRLPLGGWICWDKRLTEEADKMFGSPFELAWFKSENTTKRSIMVRCLHGGMVNADTEANKPYAKRFHPTQKPVLVMEEIIAALVKPGERVLDAFAGSGSTLLACERMGNTCCAMEIDPEYCNVILQRWFDATGEEPQRAQ